MAKTIRELAEICGVSEQAIRKWCARNRVKKDVSQHYMITTQTESAILRYYREKHSATSCEPGTATEALIEMLKKELEEKDRQITSLQTALENVTESLKSAQESIKAAQLLQANAEQKLLSAPDTPTAAADAAAAAQPLHPQRWWHRFTRK